MARKSKTRYELKSKLGEGGMGVVWRAHDTVLHADVALKMLQDVTDPVALRLFYEECNRQASLVHPNVIEVRDVGAFDDNGIDQPYLVMPLLRGQTLEDLMRRGGRELSVERCVDIFTQACRGLQAAHEHGLLHRDIKPSNIFILDDDSVKIIDFGVAHPLDGSRTVGRKGTLLYMSPEQLALKPLTRASDVFSLAVVFYEVLTGKQPFRRSNEEAVAEAIQRYNPPAASSFNPDITAGLSQVLHKAMAKLPSFRFSTAKDFGDTVRRAYYDTNFSVFDSAKLGPRLQKASEAFERGDLGFAQEMVNELESEGYLTSHLQNLAANVSAAVQKRDIDQLLESAKARIQDGEYRLALQRVHEALEIDARNQEALALQHDIEGRRSEADIVDWLSVGRQHLDKFSFSHARQAAEHVLEQHPDEERAVQFLTQVKRKRSEYQEISEEKEKVYEAALEAQRQNDLSSALTNMRRVLELDKLAPDLRDPGRNATFESLYNRLHSEHEAIGDQYRQAKQALDRGNYAEVADLCDKLLEKYPQHTLFKALKYDNNERWRRAISSRIIGIEEEADREPDLDRRVSLLEGVVSQNTGVPEFENLLRAVRDKRDLVNGIVTRARELADHEQFGEALVQWETLQTIHPEYPGLDFEIDSIRRRRSLAERVSLRKRWLQQISQEGEEGHFSEALRHLSLALEDFPDDGEFLEIEKGLRQKQRVATEAEGLLTEGKRLLEADDLAEGLNRLRKAYELGARAVPAKTTLIDGLLQAARSTQETPEEATSYLREILNLESNNQAALGMLRFFDDRLEHEIVDQSIYQARQLQTNTEYTPAIELLKQAIKKYPRNGRLQEVLQEIENGQAHLRGHDLEVLRRKRLEADQGRSGPTIYNDIDAVKRVANRYKNDSEVQEESRLLQTKLQTMASDKRTSILNEPARMPDVKMRPPEPSSEGTSRWPLLAGVATALLLLIGTTIAVIAFRHRPSEKAQAGSFKRLSEFEKSLPPTVRRSEPQSTAPPAPTPSAAAPAAGQRLTIAGVGSISLDGTQPEAVKNGVFSRDLENGQHRLQWTDAAGRTINLNVTVADGRPASIGSLSGARLSPTMIVSGGDKQALVFSNDSSSLQVDSHAEGRTGANGREIPVDNGSHTFRVTSAYGAQSESVEIGPQRILAVSFGPESGNGALSVQFNQSNVNAALMTGDKPYRSVVSRTDKLSLVNIPAGNYRLQARKDGFLTTDTPVVVESARTEQVTVSLQPFMALTFHSLPAADVLIDDRSVGATDATGKLTVMNVPAGRHRVQAKRQNKSNALELTVDSSTSQKPIELPLDRGPGKVLISLTPDSSAFTVTQLDGKAIGVSGKEFDLPAGTYRITVHADHFQPRSDVIVVSPEQTNRFSVALSPERTGTDQARPLDLTGWDKGEWDFDSGHKAILHKKAGISLYSGQSAQGVYQFTIARDKTRGFNRNGVEWIAGYLDHDNYLLFSIKRNVFTAYLVQGGNKVAHGDPIPVPNMSSYTVKLEIGPERVVTSISDGTAWRPLQDWEKVMQNLSRGQFGFKDQVAVYNFQFAPQSAKS